MSTRLRLLVFLGILASFAMPTTARMSDAERRQLEARIKSLDKDQIHELVAAVENDPLSDMATETRPALVVYFEDIHYDVCLDQIGFLLDSKNKLHEHVFWQVVFSSGDFFLQHPDMAKDRVAYMLAGLESGLNVYEHILAKKPKVKLVRLDELVALRTEGKLIDYVRANPCEKK